MRAVPAGAQDSESISEVAVGLASVAAVTGYEQAAIDSVLRLLPGARRDRAGNANLQLGAERSPSKRLVVCPLDEPGYVVGRVQDEGYLTLRRVPGPVSPLFDQQIEGQRVAVYGNRGPVAGVVAVRSIHLTRGRTAPPEAPFTVDEAYVDVGADSPAEVERLGVRVLAPVTLAKRPHLYGSALLAAPIAGRRAACGALLLAARQSRVRAKLLPSVLVAFTVQDGLSGTGLAALANAVGPFSQTVIVDGMPGPFGSILRGAELDSTTRPKTLGQVAHWALPVRFFGTAVETVSLTDADSLRAALVRWIGGDE
jgi:putative aminopeptidase FrvX